MAESISEALCRHVAETPFEALPPGAVTAAKHVLLDAAGVMAAASGQSPDVAPFIAAAREAGEGRCSILGTGHAASAPMAALANGAMAHALDYEDAFDAAPGHPNASMVPAVLALAQARGPVSGRTLLAALAVGCDLSCRIGLSLKRPMEAGGWYPPPIVGAYAAAAGCARVLELDWKRTRDAVSLMLCQATMPGEIMHDRETVIRAVREAFPAQAAVTSALLAERGVAGFAAPLEGKAGFFALYAGGEYDTGVLIEGLGKRWYGEELSFKPWPACRGTHAFIELALELQRQHRFGWRDVREVIAGTDPIHAMLMQPEARKRAPHTVIDAKFSIPFTMALALVRGRVTLDDFGEASLGDADVLAVAQKVKGEAAGGFARTVGSGGALRVRLADGREVQAELSDALGSPKRPMPADALLAKFVDCLARAARPVTDARGIAQRILRIEDEPDAGAVFRSF